MAARVATLICYRLPTRLPKRRVIEGAAPITSDGGDGGAGRDQRSAVTACDPALVTEIFRFIPIYMTHQFGITSK
jgi:hypothetical protein